MPDNAMAHGARHSVSQRIANHLATFDERSLPAATVAMAKRLMLDTLAVAWAGRDAPGSAETCALMTEEGGRAEGTLWGSAVKLPAGNAAFVNSLYGAALDYDAVNTVHADVVALPAALAVAERQHAGGRAFLAAYVLGADLACRLGGAITGAHRGWFTTSIFGVFGAAAAAARLLKMDEGAIAHALGIALSQSAGTQQANVEQALTKRMQSAFASRAGVFSALLAARGITAPREAIDGKFGLYALYQEGNPEQVLEGLGRTFAVDETNFKKYPTCACSHAALDAALSLIVEYDLRPEDVDRIEVVLSPLMFRLVGAPFDPGASPQVAAQFSAQYAMASALLRRRVSIEEIQDAAILDPRIRDLTRRVAIRVDESIRNSRAPATVAMDTKRNGRVERTVSLFPWGNEAPPTEDELAGKLDACFGYGAQALAPDRRQRLIERVRDIEHCDDMSRFFDGIA